MSIPVIIRNVDWIKFGLSNERHHWRVCDHFMSDPHYCWPSENYLHHIISEALEDERGEFPLTFEWCYPWKPDEWFKVREGADRADYLGEDDDEDDIADAA